MESPNGAILVVRLRLIACAVERRRRLIAAGGKVTYWVTLGELRRVRGV